MVPISLASLLHSSARVGFDSNVCVRAFSGSLATGHASVCALLLDLGAANPNAAASDGDTPLFFAARRGRFDAVALLLAKGADPAQTNR